MSTEAARNFPLNPQTDFIMYLFCSVWHYWIDVAAGISTKSSLDFFSEFTPVWLKPDKEFISPEESGKITRLLNRGEVVVRPVSRKQEHLTVNALSAAVSFVYVPANLQGLHKIKICIFFLLQILLMFVYFMKMHIYNASGSLKWFFLTDCYNNNWYFGDES